MQLGTFAFLVTIFFRPTVFMTASSGQELLSPLLFTIMVAIVTMVLWAVVLGVVYRLAPRVAAHITVISALALPVATLLLIAFALLAGPMSAFGWMLNLPLAVMLLLGLAAISQIYCFYNNAGLDAYSLLFSTGTGILLAALLSFIAFSLIDVYPLGVSLVAAVMALSGFLLFVAWRSALTGARAKAVSMPTRATEMESASTSKAAATGIHIREMAFIAAPVALECLICSAGPGLAWNVQMPSYLDAGGIGFLISLPLVGALLALLCWAWKRVMDIDVLLIGSALPLVLPLMFIIFSNSPNSSFLAPLGFLAELLLLILGWVGSLMIGRLWSRTETIAPVWVILLLALYGFFIVIAQCFSADVFRKGLALLSLAYLLYLLGYLFWKMHRRAGAVAEEGATQGSLDETLQAKCHTLAAQYGLSARESECLPLLAMGLSANVIARRVFLSPETVKTYRRRIYGKLGIHNHEELVASVHGV